MKNMIKSLGLLLLMAALLMPGAAYAATVETQVSNLRFLDSAGRETNVVGEAVQLEVTFSKIAPDETVIIGLDAKVTPLPVSAQPDQARIDRIVDNKVTLVSGEMASNTVRIQFSQELTAAGDYQFPIRADGKIINPETTQQTVTLQPGPAVLINSTTMSDERSTFENTLSVKEIKDGTGKDAVVTGYNFTGKIILQLRDKYNNMTAELPQGYNLVMRFVPRTNSEISKYDITPLGNGDVLTEDYQVVQPVNISTDPHSLGSVTLTVKVKEDANENFDFVPKIYAALSSQESGFIDAQDRQIVSNIGFIPHTICKSGELSAYGTVQAGALDNHFRFTIDNIFPAAGKKIRLTMPKGFISAETNTNYVDFDYDDIGKTKMVQLSKIPTKVTRLTEDSFKLSVYPADKSVQLAYQVTNLDLYQSTAGLAASSKSKLSLSKTKKTAQADGKDAVEALLQLNDAAGNTTKDITPDYGIFIWAEREEGKVSQVDQIVQLEDGPQVKLTVNDENGLPGVYEIVGSVPNTGEVKFGITSTQDGKPTIKAALAADATSALMIRDKLDGLVSNTIKPSFTPYASSDSWYFTDVKVSGIKATELSGKDNKYQVLKTKKSNGTDKFSVSAKLTSPGGKIKMKDQPVTISCTDDNLVIAAKNGTTKDNKIQVTTDGSGQVKFDLSTANPGTYTVTVLADNAVGTGKEFTIKVPYDEKGGTIVDDENNNSDDITERLKKVSKIVLEEQSSFMLAVGDDLYALFKLYDANGKEIKIKNDSEAQKAISTLTFASKPTGSDLEGGKNKDIDVEEYDNGIMLTFTADELGKYGINMTITNGKTGKANFTVDQTNRIVSMQLSYNELGLELGGISGAGKLIFTDSRGVETEKALPIKGIELSASGKGLERFTKETGVVKVLKKDDYSGEIITVTAYDRSHNLTATWNFVIGHDILPLEFFNTDGLVHQTIRMTAKIQDEANRNLPSGALDPKNGAKVILTVLSKPTDALVNTELVDNGASFMQNGMNVIRVRSDRIGTVRLRVDIRVVDPNYSSKYPIYTYLSGIADLKFNYPGILDSQPFIEGYASQNATLMYIGSNFFISRGVEQYMDVPPFIQGERTFIPLRALGDSLNATVNYNGNTQQVSISGGGNWARVTIGSPVIATDQGEVISDVVPFIQDGRTFLPLRVIAETFQCKVDAVYDDEQVVGVIFQK